MDTVWPCIVCRQPIELGRTAEYSTFAIHELCLPTYQKYGGNKAMIDAEFEERAAVHHVDQNVRRLENIGKRTYDRYTCDFCYLTYEDGTEVGYRDFGFLKKCDPCSAKGLPHQLERFHPQTSFPPGPRSLFDAHVALAGYYGQIDSPIDPADEEPENEPRSSSEDNQPQAALHDSDAVNINLNEQSTELVPEVNFNEPAPGVDSSEPVPKADQTKASEVNKNEESHAPEVQVQPVSEHSAPSMALPSLSAATKSGKRKRRFSEASDSEWVIKRSMNELVTSLQQLRLASPDELPFGPRLSEPTGDVRDMPQTQAVIIKSFRSTQPVASPAQQVLALPVEFAMPLAAAQIQSRMPLLMPPANAGVNIPAADAGPTNALVRRCTNKQCAAKDRKTGLSGIPRDDKHKNCDACLKRSEGYKLKMRQKGRCAHGCGKQCDTKPDGSYYASCEGCREKARVRSSGRTRKPKDP
ncbi:hypothetical protein B0H63DRAFT_455503 [Podospora didyma]|uniref:Uncharacterized protein n=1 Tax=Podospora didyma TaxID=330526 RepID=A0AAE0K276_9PEZI|nr:hypothetical protein B0H63DRAFT_455503 [Podospora didyma]